MTYLTRKYLRKLCAAVYAEKISLGATPEEASAAAWDTWERVLAAREVAKRREVRLPWFVQAVKH